MAKPSFIEQILSIDLAKTSYSDPLIVAYLEGKLEGIPFTLPSTAAVLDKIESRKAHSAEHRAMLVRVLLEQYRQSGIDVVESPVHDQIQSLNSPNTYTVCTGQQIHLGLGPMYVVYKILNVIRLTEELNEKYDRFHFVPIFWMASEDHDLEEIQQMKLYGKDFTWEPGQTGAVGRMQSTGISAMLSELKNELNLNEDTLLFIDQLLKASESGNLSELSRNLLHQLFGDIGLLVIDPDQEDFKRSLRDVALKDLQYGGNEQYLESSQVLKAQGFEPQIHLRDSNLFLLGEKSRDRVDKLDNQLIVNGKVLGSLDNIKDFVDNWLVNLSPNVVLRPLYQEALLPNVIYVAGPSELKYWMQLASVFALHSLSMPLVFLRTNVVLIPAKFQEEIDAFDLSDYYKSYEDFTQIINDLDANRKKDLDLFSEEIRVLLKKYDEAFSSLFKGYNLKGKIGKIDDKIRELDQISSDRYVAHSRAHSSLKKILRIKDLYFSTDNVQERKKHLIEFAYLLDSLKHTKGLFGFSDLGQVKHVLHK